MTVPVEPMLLVTLVVVVVSPLANVDSDDAAEAVGCLSGEQLGCSGALAGWRGGDVEDTDDDGGDADEVDADGDEAVVPVDTELVTVLSDDSDGSLRTTIADVQPNRLLMGWLSLRQPDGSDDAAGWPIDVLCCGDGLAQTTVEDLRGGVAVGERDANGGGAVSVAAAAGWAAISSPADVD